VSKRCLSGGGHAAAYPTDEREKQAQRVKMGYQEIAGVLREFVVLCCASSCSGVDLRGTGSSIVLISLDKYFRFSAVDYRAEIVPGRIGH
jgi:hypothetical protein